MKSLILLRGLPGCGKSTFITKNKLEPFTIESDKVRLMYSSFRTDKEGNISIDGKEDAKVWATVMDMLETRMKRGAFTVLDATNIYNKDLSKYKSLAEKYRYRVYVVDFTDVPVEECKFRNSHRDYYKVVPDFVIDKFAASINDKVPSSYTVINHNDFNINDFKRMIPMTKFMSFKKSFVMDRQHGFKDPSSHSRIVLKLDKEIKNDQ